MAAADETSLAAWKLCLDGDGGIDAKKTEAGFYKTIMGSNNLKSETYLVLLRTAVAIVDVYQTHRTAHAALGAEGPCCRGSPVSGSRRTRTRIHKHEQILVNY